VTISRFYRDRQLWVHLEKRILPELLDRFPYGLTAWSAGCACGEEPYSLAMAWEAFTTSATTSPPLRILATDAGKVCLERAKAGQYSLSSLKEMPDELKAHWFEKVPGKRQWQIAPFLGKHIEWLDHDLLSPPPPHLFHLIFLRNNLLTYHRGQVLETAFEHITGTLAAGGVLIIGAHEHLPARNRHLKRDVDCPWVYYSRP
jgi:chemotaxis protein methyltransferase CheR